MSAATDTAPAAPAPAGGDAKPARKPRKHGWYVPYLLLVPGVAWLIIFFVVPLIQLGAASLQSQWPGAPGYYYRDVNWHNYVDALSSYGAHFLRSLLYAAIATLICFVVAFPLAYAMAFKAGKWRNIMMVLVVAPFFTSFILRTIAWRQILADDGIVATTLRNLHLLPGGHITETPVAVIAGLAYNFLPFMVLPIYTSLERADPRLLEAGRDLYANRWTTLRTVTIPLATPGILAGTLLTFIPAAGDYVNAELLGSDRSTKMVGNAINSEFFTVLGGYPTAAALSICLMVLILVLVMGYVRRFGTEEIL